jgi:hypothetical protein
MPLHISRIRCWGFGPKDCIPTFAFFSPWETSSRALNLADPATLPRWPQSAVASSFVSNLAADRRPGSWALQGRRSGSGRRRRSPLIEIAAARPAECHRSPPRWRWRVSASRRQRSRLRSCHDPNQSFPPNKSGSLAMFAAIRRALKPYDRLGDIAADPSRFSYFRKT